MPVFLLSCALCAVCLPAAAQSGERSSPSLTSRGRFMVAGQVSGFWSNDTPALQNSYPTWTVRADPSLTYFFLENVGLGVTVSGSYERGQEFGGYAYVERGIGFGVEGVWNVALAPGWSFMLRPSLGYGRRWADISGSSMLQPTEPTPVDVDVQVRAEEVRQYVRLALALPFVFALSDSVSLGFGPTFSYGRVFGATTAQVFVNGSPVSAVPRSAPSNRLQLGAILGIYASF
jgi:hypothetical protein